MRSAETIILEYLGRGYSIECLRVLAESRSEPLCSEMLAFLDKIQFEKEISDVACVAEPTPAGEFEGDMIFFVAEDDESASGEPGVNFDLIAEDETDGAEETVAEIMVPATNALKVSSIDSTASETGRYAREAAGVWSRFWPSRGEISEAEESMDVAPAESVAEAIEPDAAQEGSAAEPEAREEREDAGAAQDREPVEELVEDRDENSEVDILGELAAAAAGPAAQAACEPEAALEDAPGTAVASLPAAEESPLADASSDYLPGVPDADAGKRLLLEAQATVATKSGEISEMPAEEEPVAQGAVDIQQPALHPLVAAALSSAPEEKQLTRKERRRRERIQKKKAGKTASLGKVESLPEIVLTRSEGTETLLPEPADVQSSAPAPETCEAECRESANSEAAIEEPIRDEEAEKPAEAAMPELEQANFASDEILSEGGAVEHASAGGDSAAAETAESPEGEPSFGPESGDYLMIVANGGFAIPSGGLREEDGKGAAAEPAAEEEDAAVSTPENNVILFRAAYPAFVVDEQEEEEDTTGEHSFLRVLPLSGASESEQAESEGVVMGEPEAEAETEPGIAAEIKSEPEVGADAGAGTGTETEAGTGAEQEDLAAKEAELSPLDRVEFLRALVGAPQSEEQPEPLAESENDEHVIVSLDSVPEPAPDREAEARAEVEREYQERLDEFARRLLDLQNTAAEGKAKIKKQNDRIAAREAELDEARARLEQERCDRAALSEKLAEAERAGEEKAAELRTYAGIRSEHERLYKEFEDLRKAYNEIVGDVLPGLQGERDDLALTVERQCAEEERLRGSLSTSRRRLAVGYSMGAAAVLALIALPVAGWLKSDNESRDLALTRQEVSELRARLNNEEIRSVKAEKDKVEMERKASLARMEVTKLEKKNGELSKQADQRTRELASLKASNGTPTRTSTMALQAAPREDGKLRVNEVRDPAGRIDQTVASNRSRREERAPGTASAQGDNRVAVSAVARTGLRPPAAGAGTTAAAPAAQAGTQTTRPNTAAASAASTTMTAAASGGATAKVKTGEGVAQVVYRVMGTRDPEIIEWVIRENKIQKDRRGNPRIYPDQELRLPPDGRTVQSASAARR